MSSLFIADHVASEVDFSKALERLGESSMERMEEPDEIGAAFKNFAVVTKEMANLMKNMVREPGRPDGKDHVSISRSALSRN